MIPEVGGQVLVEGVRCSCMRWILMTHIHLQQIRYQEARAALKKSETPVPANDAVLWDRNEG